jgi:hypothetical protein
MAGFGWLMVFRSHLAGQVAQDPPDAPRVQAGFGRDFVHVRSAPFEIENRAMFGGTQLLHALPEIVGLENRSRLGLRMLRNVIQSSVRQGLLTLGHLILLAKTVDEAITRGLDQKQAELVHAGKFPAGIAETLKDIAPDGLDNVRRIELGAQMKGEQAAHDLSQVRLELKEDFLCGCGIAAAQLVKQRFQGRFCFHFFFS